MIKIVNYLYKKFPNLERVSCYAMPMNLLKKTPEELRKMYEAGLKMMYIGIESGSDIVLKKVTKGATSQTIIRACRKAIDTGFTISCMVILGLGGKTYTKEHIRETKEEIIFRANHGSNAYTIKGTFPQDKQSMLEKISWMKQHPEAVRPEGLRGF